MSDCSGFRGLGNRFIHITVRRPMENAKLLAALKELLPTPKT
ncbi:MAG: hypothetical protein QW413_06060 [Nitrososphaerota archaeon]